MGVDHLFEHIGLEHVKGVGAAEHMPAEVGFGRPLAEKRRGFQRAVHAVLRVGDMEVKGRVRALAPVEIDKRKARVVGARQFRGDLVLQVAVLIEIGGLKTELANLEHAADLPALVRGDPRAERAALAARKRIGRLGGVPLVGDQFAPELQNARVRVRQWAGGGVLHHADLGGALVQRGGQRQVPLEIQAAVGRGNDVTAFEPDIGMQEVEPRRDARRADLVQHRAQVFVIARVLVAQVVVAAKGAGAVLFEHAGVIKEHQAKARPFGAGDMFIHGVGGDILCPVDRGVDRARVGAARHAAREIVVFFHRRHRREKVAFRDGDQGGAAPFALDIAVRVRRKDARAAEALAPYLGVRRGRQHANGAHFVPRGVDPVAEVFFFPHGQGA